MRGNIGRQLLVWFGVAGALLVGGVFLASGVIKAADPALFQDQIEGYRILPADLAPAAAIGLIVFESLLGLALLLGITRRPSAMIVGALLLFFIVMTAWAWSQGNAESCGCFGRLAARSPLGVIVEDVLFLAAAAAAYLWAPSHRLERSFRRVWVVLSPLMLVLPWVGPRMPVDSWVTALHRGADLGDLAADDLSVPLGEGDVLLAWLAPECPACDAAVDPLGAVAAMNSAPSVVGLFGGDRREKQRWRLDHVPAFPVAHAPEKVLRQYYRRLPVFALLRSGRVKETWYEVAPSIDELESARR